MAAKLPQVALSIPPNAGPWAAVIALGTAVIRFGPNWIKAGLAVAEFADKRESARRKAEAKLVAAGAQPALTRRRSAAP